MKNSRGLPVLLHVGVVVGATNFVGNTPLHDAAMRIDEFMEPQIAIINGLLQSGTNKGSLNTAGRTPAQVVSNNAAMNLLL